MNKLLSIFAIASFAAVGVSAVLPVKDAAAQQQSTRCYIDGLRVNDPVRCERERTLRRRQDQQRPVNAPVEGRRFNFVPRTGPFEERFRGGGGGGGRGDGAQR